MNKIKFEEIIENVLKCPNNCSIKVFYVNGNFWGECSINGDLLGIPNFEYENYYCSKCDSKAIWINKQTINYIKNEK